MAKRKSYEDGYRDGYEKGHSDTERMAAVIVILVAFLSLLGAYFIIEASFR